MVKFVHGPDCRFETDHCEFHCRRGWGGALFDFHGAGSQLSFVSDSRVNGNNMQPCFSFRMRAYPLPDALRLVSLKTTLLKFPVANFR